MRSLHSMPKSQAHQEWPTIPVAVAGLLLTVCSAFLLRDMRIEADVYGILGQEDEAVQLFDKLSKSTPGLEELLIICDAGSVITRANIDRITEIHGINNHTRSYVDYDHIESVLSDWIAGEGLDSWQLSGAPSLNSRIDELLGKDVPTVLPFAAMATFLVLAIGTRSFLLPIVIIAPLLLSLVWLAGLMSFIGVAVSAVTIAIAPLVLGIGVDGGVHFVSSWRRHQGKLEEVFAETGLAIIVTVMTSVAAFGTLIVSESPSLIRFGSQASLALAGCLLITLILLPTIARQFLKPSQAVNIRSTE